MDCLAGVFFSAASGPPRLDSIFSRTPRSRVEGPCAAPDGHEAELDEARSKVQRPVPLPSVASAMAFSHGSNDVANAIGPVAAVLSIINSGEISQSSPVPVYVLFVGAIGIVIGLATFGIRVIKTVGEKITELRPSRGFAAELAAASTVVLASYTGVPISTTHTLVGAVLGVGLARGLAALDWGVIRNIVVSWVVTLPIAAILSASFYFALLALFG